MKRTTPLCAVSTNKDLLEQQLATRKASLERAKVDLHQRFSAYAKEKECVTALEHALAKVHRFL